MVSVEVKIPFTSEYESWVHSGIKTSTIRMKKLGKRGDTFRSKGVLYKLNDVEWITLDYAMELGFYKHEGFRSAAECVAAIQAIYPEVTPDTDVCLHLFQRCPEVVE